MLDLEESNLFALNRFPGSDAVERGKRANMGITWTRHDPAGWTMGVTLGRVVRDRDRGQFGPASGLDGRSSDWLAGATFTLGNGYALAGREPWQPPLHYPLGLRFLTAQIMASLLLFPPDMAPVDAEINRLNNQILVRYYEHEWRQVMP